ncbi:unnamed protein product [Rotaria sp. Silwood1]|nr:unnamed protein product [Rotaria sp. Silwood1]
MYFQIIFCTLPAILIERKQRRGALALYMTNLAVELLFKMAVDRKIFSPLHNGEILIFAIASAIYTFILKTTSDHKHNTLVFSVIKLLPIEIYVKNNQKKKKKQSTKLRVCLIADDFS